MSVRSRLASAWFSCVSCCVCSFFIFFFQAEDGIRYLTVTGVQTCALPIFSTGSPENVQHLVGRPGFTLTVGSALDRAIVAPLVATADVVFHLAAAVGVQIGRASCRERV